jgi:hypothetical protein
VEIYSSAGAELPHFTELLAGLPLDRRGTNAFSGVAPTRSSGASSRAGGDPALVTGEAVSANYFDVLGVRPALGRGFLPEENVGEGQHPGAWCSSHTFWQRRFGGRPMSSARRCS